ncbi:hypothetical protein F2P79_010904 [Pimephales promelas]|nr:hypothetical protein F2P79_010904 [Pimephales promelas]
MSALVAHYVPTVPADTVRCGTWGKYCVRAHTGHGLTKEGAGGWQYPHQTSLQSTDAIRKLRKEE